MPNSPVACLSAFLVVSLLALPSNAQNRSTEQEEAGITDQTAECQPYDYPPVDAAIGNFPVNWATATILPNDIAAAAKYQSIVGLIPNIAPKGTQPGSLDGVFDGSYNDTDPDCWWTSTGCTIPKHPGIPADIITTPEPSSLGYGFDDGPNCSHNAFYDYLWQKNQKATMYYIGSNVMDYPLEAQRALKDGHEICVHTWSHHYMTALTNEQLFAEFWYAIKLVVGVTPTCWRPPYGDIDDRVRAVAQAMGLRSILWTYDSEDWSEGDAGVTPASIDANYQGLISAAENGTFATAGTIMLTHELNNFTMSEAMKFHDQLGTVFKYLVPVGVALNVTQPYVESGYSLPTFQQYISGITMSNGSSSSSGSGNGQTPAGSSGSNPSSSNGQGSSSNKSAGSRSAVSSGGVSIALLGVIATVLVRLSGL
ncbi:carbohydrate esterase family 4 protein [Hygrophoropsis aurantiaca]|uniref:Carbohydrate esterase family 4 protein n=1 Tax=Hygrophoropsis aurantiaca TaxID=72124 RepID=A0ACB8AC44_9AGAM|nr:carbohydrate esterase family 4 protein [Hygrophoropsis aurantiaca]